MSNSGELTYAIYESNKCWHRAVKMDDKEAGPHFITLNQDTKILDAGGKMLGLADCHVGDRLSVGQVTSLHAATSTTMEEGPATWPAKPTAKALTATLATPKERIERLAVVIEVKELAQKTHYRFYDPFTMAEKPLPWDRRSDPPKHHALIKVTYIKHEAKTWMDQFHQICMPHDYPGHPENLVQQRGEIFEPVYWRALSKDESKLISRFLVHGEAEKVEPALVDDLLLAGAASMQASMRKECTFINNTIIPSIESYGT